MYTFGHTAHPGFPLQPQAAVPPEGFVALGDVDGQPVGPQPDPELGAAPELDPEPEVDPDPDPELDAEPELVLDEDPPDEDPPAELPLEELTPDSAPSGALGLAGVLAGSAQATAAKAKQGMMRQCIAAIEPCIAVDCKHKASASLVRMVAGWSRTTQS
jgi:hypothetical protein